MAPSPTVRQMGMFDTVTDGTNEFQTKALGANLKTFHPGDAVTLTPRGWDWRNHNIQLEVRDFAVPALLTDAPSPRGPNPDPPEGSEPEGPWLWSDFTWRWVVVRRGVITDISLETPSDLPLFSNVGSLLTCGQPCQEYDRKLAEILEAADPDEA